MTLSVKSIINKLQEKYPGLNSIQSWGETMLVYNPDDLLKRGVYFCTFKEKDGENDSSSKLSRDGVFRMSFGISKQRFLEHFGRSFQRPPKGGIIQGDYDFTLCDRLTPHPVYGWMSWVAVINPSEKTFEEIEELLQESYLLAVEKYQKRIK